MIPKRFEVLTIPSFVSTLGSPMRWGRGKKRYSNNEEEEEDPILSSFLRNLHRSSNPADFGESRRSTTRSRFAASERSPINEGMGREATGRQMGGEGHKFSAMRTFMMFKEQANAAQSERGYSQLGWDGRKKK